MTDTVPLPAEGGSYIRHPDGRLERAGGAAPPAPPPEEAPAKAKAGKPAKEE